MLKIYIDFGLQHLYVETLSTNLNYNLKILRKNSSIRAFNALKAGRGSGTPLVDFSTPKIFALGI